MTTDLTDDSLSPKPPQPIPPDHVGLSMLYLDLDKNGRMNLMSSQVAGCENGSAWLALYEETDSGFRDLGRALSFETDCHQFQDIRFQHLEVSDVDADGDLDVFAAGFQRIHPGEGAHQRQNVFRAVRGLAQSISWKTEQIIIRMFFLQFYRQPYDNLASLTIPYCDFVIRYENIQEDYITALKKAGIKKT